MLHRENTQNHVSQLMNSSADVCAPVGCKAPGRVRRVPASPGRLKLLGMEWGAGYQEANLGGARGTQDGIKQSQSEAVVLLSLPFKSDARVLRCTLGNVA